MKRISRKINVSFGVLIALLLFSQGLSMVELRRLERHNRELFEQMEAENLEYHSALEANGVVVDIPTAHPDIDTHIEIRRTIMPGVIALMVAIVVVLIFWFMVGYYYVRPTLMIQRKLHDYLRHNIPFNVPMAGRDEIVWLKDDIETLISLLKNKG